MGITANYARVSESELTEMLTGDSRKVDALLNENLVAERVGKGDRTDFLCARYAGGYWGQMDFLEQEMKALNLTEDDLLAQLKQKGLHLWFDLDKSFNELHVFLTGEHFPLNLPIVTEPLSLALVAEGAIPGTEHYGYGPARYIRSATVKTLASAIAQADYDQLAETNEINGDEEDDRETFDRFKKFYLQAAINNEAIVLIFL